MKKTRAPYSSTITRRRFINTCAACSACMAAMPLVGINSCKPREKMRIHIIYSVTDIVQPGPDWPNIGFDFGPVMEYFNRALSESCPEFEFTHSMASGPGDAENILNGKPEKPDNGYIVFQLNCWNRVVQPVIETGKPVLYVDYQYAGSGGFLVYTAGFLRNNIPNLGFVASSDINDLIKAVKQFNIVHRGGTISEFVSATARIRRARTPEALERDYFPDDLKTISADECLKRMQSSRILAVRDEKALNEKPLMNIPLEYIPFAVVNEAWKAADRDEARLIAEGWQKKAAEVIEVPFEELENSAAMYLGMKKVLKDHDANAITVNCLGGFYGGHIHAYPCLGFHELNNEGLVGACECDINSTATMVAFNNMTTGRPGYISDPVIDTAKRQIIYAHCVASNKVFGPDGPENPFSIMTHSEDRQGAAVRSILPVNYMTTSMKIQPERKEIILHRAVTVDNDPDDRACRTKLCAEPVGDIEKLFTMWDIWGWHRVTFYGDLKEPAYALADKIGWKVVEEA